MISLLVRCKESSCICEGVMISVVCCYGTKMTLFRLGDFFFLKRIRLGEVFWVDLMYRVWESVESCTWFSCVCSSQFPDPVEFNSN